MLKLVLLILAETHSASWLYAIAEWLSEAARPIAVAIVIAATIFAAVLKNVPPIRSRRLDAESSHQQPPSSESGQQKVRRKLLKIIQREIDYRLATWLHERVKHDLYMEDQRQRVGDLGESVPHDMPDGIISLHRVLKPFRTSTAPIPLASTQKMREVFMRPDIQGKLLILGEPGSGKTTTLLHLAKDLIEEASKDDSLPIPLLLELSTWNEDQSIDQWMTETLEKRYNIPTFITQRWQNNLLPLLDGLGELGLPNQQKCIDAINVFLTEKVHYGLIVCCRHEEYEASQVTLSTLNGAVYLEPLQPEQIQAFFQQFNRPYLWEHVREDSALRELAQKPLFLSMLIVAYQGNSITNEAELVDAFIAQKLRENNSQVYSPGKGPNPNQTRVYLAWLAQQLESACEPEFLIEGLQPCMLRRNEIYLYQLIYGSIYGLCFGLYFGLYGGLLFGLLFGLSAELEPSRQLSEKLVFSCSKALSKGLRFGLRAGLLVGLTFGLVCGLFAWLFSGLLAGLLLLLIVGLSFGLLVGLLVGLMSGLSSGLIDEKTFPNQGIWRSLQHSIIVILIFGLSFGLSGGLLFGLGFGLEGWLYSDLKERLLLGLSGGLNMGFLLGLSLGLMYELIGGPVGSERLGLSGRLQAVVQHLALRIVLAKNGNIPWNYARFLNYAVELRFIQRVGGRYRFTHDLLRKHFAVMSLE